MNNNDIDATTTNDIINSSNNLIINSSTNDIIDGDEEDFEIDFDKVSYKFLYIIIVTITIRPNL